MRASLNGLPGSIERDSSLATTAMVASGEPSSCAAAAANPPSAVNRCSRDNSWRATASASDMRRASSATDQA
jgi:hypothetical protein